MNGYNAVEAEFEIKRLSDINRKKQARILELETALRGILAITNDSEGVAGYHLNGDVASWGEFKEIEWAIDAMKGEIKKL